MASKRVELDATLKTFATNVYYQPPKGFKMSYPCIVYNRTGRDDIYANNKLIRSHTVYQLLVIDEDPDSTIASELVETLEYCSKSSEFILDNLYQEVLTIFY